MRKRWLLALLGFAALAMGAAWRFSLRGVEATDAAQVDGRVSNVSGRVAGRVKRVLVADNQFVRAGAVLVELEADELETLPR